MGEPAGPVLIGPAPAAKRDDSISNSQPISHNGQKTQNEPNIRISEAAEQPSLTKLRSREAPGSTAELFAMEILISPEQGSPPSVDIVAIHDYDERSVKWIYKERKAVIEQKLDRGKESAQVQVYEVTSNNNVSIDAAAHPKTEVFEAASLRNTEPSISRPSTPLGRDPGISWLQDPKMLPNIFPQARILAFTYPIDDLKKLSLDPSSRGPRDFVERASLQLILKIGEMRQGPDYQKVPVVFVAAGFGGLVVQKAISLSQQTASPQGASDRIERQSGNTSSLSPDQIADIMLIDTPSPKKEAQNLNDFFKTPHNLRMSAIVKLMKRMESGWGSPSIDKLWAEFWACLTKRDQVVRLSWLHSVPLNSTNRTADSKKVTRHTSKPLADKEGPVITVYRVPVSSQRRLTHFRGSGDNGYKATVSRLLETLLLKAVSNTDYSNLEISLMTAGSRLPSSMQWKPSSVRDEWKRPLLHLAVMAANPEGVNRILGHGGNSQVKGYKGQTALHLAVRLFSEFDNLPDDEEKDTKQNGMIQIISLLLSFTKKAELNNTRDDRGRTVPDIIQKKEFCQCPTPPCMHDKIRGMLYSHQPRVVRQTDETSNELWEGWRSPKEGTIQHAASERTRAIIGGFYSTNDGLRSDYELPSILDLIYEKSWGPVRVLSKVTSRVQSSSATENPEALCRWIHLPANNEQWVHDLFIRLGQRENSMNGQRHTGYTVINRHLIPQTKTYKNEEKPTMMFPLQPSTTHGSSSQPGLRSIPEGTQLKAADNSKSNHPGFIEILNSDWDTLWANLPRPAGLESDLETIVLFMPVLSYEEHRARKKMTKAIERVQRMRPSLRPRYAKALSSAASSTTAERQQYDMSLVEAYLNFKDVKPLHCRRTLDQYWYHMLDNTEVRDSDQVVYKWARNQYQRRLTEKTQQELLDDYLEHAAAEFEGGDTDDSANEGDGNEETQGQTNLDDMGGDDSEQQEDQILYKAKHRPIIMVDQLWLWVLPDGTVISSLPNSANPSQTYGLQYKLEKSLFDDVDNSIRSVDDLTTAILKNCVDFFRHKGPCSVKFQDCFQYSISEIAHAESRLYVEYKEAVDKLDIIEQRAKETSKNLSFSTVVSEYTEKFSRITEETTRLVEAMDIQDELNIINSILVCQETVLNELLRVVEPANDGTGNAVDSDNTTKTALGSSTRIREAIQIVKQNKASIKDMLTSAERVQNDLKQLLDFKQQQSNAWEMKYSKKLAQQGRRQNNIMLMFTLVTIVFLPLSFLSSFFAIGVADFPRDPDSGEVAWPIGRLSAYLFGFSLVLSVPLVMGALYINQVARIAKKKGRKRGPQLPSNAGTVTTSVDPDSDESDSDVESASAHQHRFRPRRRKNKGRRDQAGRKAVVDQEEEDNDEEEDEDDEYARLLGRFKFHHKIPFVRRLWKYDTYQAMDFEGRHVGSDDGVEEIVWDYPLNRCRKMAAWPVKATLEWMGLAKLSQAFYGYETERQLMEEPDERVRELLREQINTREASRVRQQALSKNGGVGGDREIGVGVEPVRTGRALRDTLPGMRKRRVEDEERIV